MLRPGEASSGGWVSMRKAMRRPDVCREAAETGPIRARRKRRRLVGVVLAALLGFAGQAGIAAAQEAPAPSEPGRPYSHNRYMIGLSGVTAVATSKDLDPSMGVHLRFGGRMHPHLALEVFGEWHDRFDDENGHFTAWATGMNLRTYALTGRIQPFLVTGGALIQTREMGDGSARADLGFAPRAGLGLDYYLTRDLAISVDATYVIPVGEPAGLDFISINWGLQWH